uniref:HID1 domain containing n=1 Tax=Cyclopterus lumpus TaxID=8103 RepID=A0A8C2WFS9_CYCLU
MGNTDTKLHFRKAVIQLTTKTQPVEASDDAFWDQFWADSSTTVQDVFALVPAAEIRAVREESPSNLATLCYKAVERLVQSADSGCRSEKQRQTVLNCTRLLTRILPYIFEDADWRGFFWSTVPGAGVRVYAREDDARPLAESLLLAIADLLFCPDFTAQSRKKSGPDSAEDIRSIDSCEYIWEAGVGFAQSPPLNYVHDLNRTELLKLLLTCLSEAMYLPPSSERRSLNPWVSFFCSTENRHALPLFTSLLNVVCAYDPVGFGVPYNHLMFSDYREQLVEQAVQILIVTLDSLSSLTGPENLFVNYLSRIHREEDLSFILKGLARLMNNPLVQTYLPHSAKKIQFHQELLILFWKFCDFNKKFLFFVLKSSDVLDVLVPILFSLDDARADQSRVGLMHIGVFILLLLSGERNFGVRLNKPYALRVPMDIPVFTGTHADLLILVTSRDRRTPAAAASVRLPSLSMLAANKLLHLLEAFSTPWFLFSSQQNHHLVFFLLEVFNNIIQYQFDGNCNLVYAVIRKRNIFHQLANLPSDAASIQKALQRKTKSTVSRSNSTDTESAEGSGAAAPNEPGTLKTSLEATPRIDKITEKSQVSLDGTMMPLHHSDAPRTPAGDTAPEVRRPPRLPHASLCSQSDPPPSPSSLCFYFEKVNRAESEAARSRLSSMSSPSAAWSANTDWVVSWKAKLPLQTIMRLLQVLVPQVEKICIDKGLTDESEILKFLQHGTLVGLLPVPHPILIRKYQANAGTAMWFRTYMWGVIYLRNVDPPIWYDTDIRLFEIQRI